MRVWPNSKATAFTTHERLMDTIMTGLDHGKIDVLDLSEFIILYIINPLPVLPFDSIRLNLL